MRGGHSLVAVLAFLAAGCSGEKAEPLDGGIPLQFETDPEAIAIAAKDPCRRREKGGWHYSAGHCSAMTPQHFISGVWVTAMEERSFLAGDRRIPDPNDPRRFDNEIELDSTKPVRLAGRIPSSPDGDAYLLTFIGRRMRDPLWVNCQGVPSFTFVVDHLLSATYLGSMKPIDWEAFKVRARLNTVTHRHGGAWGQLEEKAIRDCA